MPLTFPSHQGLVAPLRRRWPGRFHVLGLCIGAAAPDLVDGVAGAGRGHLGQSYGHSLIGLFALCLPLGLALTWFAVALGGWLTRQARANATSPGVALWLGRRIELLNNVPGRASVRRRISFTAFSVWVGALSHLFFDFITHGSFYLLYPFCENVRLFPSWWYTKWFEIPIPWYADPYPAGPHLAAWILLSLLGIVLLWRPWRTRPRSRRPERR